jgi:hypothetical protein
MKLEQILNEKLNSFVYMKETIKMLSIILSRNVFVLNPFRAGEREFYVLKTSASRSDIVGDEKAISIIQLNGDKLNAEIKKKNVGFYLNDKNKGVGDNLYSDERTIKNAANFIEQISVLIEGDDIIPVSELKEIESMCKEMNIPLYFFKNRADFQKNNRQKQIKLATPKYNYKREQHAGIPDTVKSVLYFFKNNDIQSVSPKYGKFLNYFLIAQQKPSFIKQVKKDLASVKNNELGEQAIADMFKKAGTDNVEAIINQIAEKWKLIISKSKKKDTI